jgi:hypothetical protein
MIIGATGAVGECGLQQALQAGARMLAGRAWMSMP